MHDRTVGGCTLVYFPDPKPVAGCLAAVYPRFWHGHTFTVGQYFGCTGTTYSRALDESDQSSLCLYHAGAVTVFYSPTDFRSDFTVVILRLGHGLCDLCTVPDFLASYWLEVVVYPVSDDSAALYQL